MSVVGRSPSVSVTILTLDEAANLPRCLESIAGLHDQLVIVDSGSTDGTLAIARAAGAELVEQPFLGYVAQGQLALERARGDWVLVLDADEWLTPELRRSIEAAVRANEDANGGAIAGYEIERRAFLLGAWIGHGGYREWKLRLVRRGRARFDGDEPHSRLVADGPVARLAGALGHFPDIDLAHQLAKLDRYAAHPARRAHEGGRRPSLLGLLFEPPWVFVQRLVLQSGWRDGVRGVVLAAMAAIYFFLRHAKRWELAWAAPAPTAGDSPAPDSGDRSAASRAQ